MKQIEVKDLTKTYYTDHVETPVLRGVSFEIEKGAFVAIMGPSGSGKSTLLHILGFLDTPSSGTYLFEGKDSCAYKEKEVAGLRNRKFGFVFQAFHLLARVDVIHNVMLPLLYSDVPKADWEKRSRAALDSVGMSHRLSYDPAKLSGGEKQRVAIARALVNKPEVIFADEPTGNLDSQTGKRIMESLAILNKENGHTIVLITHESDIAAYARRIITIRDGRIVIV